MKPNYSKYRNKITEVNGIKFSSKKEAKRYKDLKLLQAAGEIRGLTLQETFVIKVNGVKICSYRCDFQYEEKDLQHEEIGEIFWVLVVEDCKGYRTPVYRIKKKLLQAVHGIEIRET
jgi:uncharacterized protein DUF1064